MPQPDLDTEALLAAVEQWAEGEAPFNHAIDDHLMSDLWPQALRALAKAVPELPEHPHAKLLGCAECCEAAASIRAVLLAAQERLLPRRAEGKRE